LNREILNSFERNLKLFQKIYPKADNDDKSAKDIDKPLAYGARNRLINEWRLVEIPNPLLGKGP
jgi:hypothetical protein